MKMFQFLRLTMTAFVVVVGSVGCTTTPPTIQTGPDAEVSFDGLHKVDNTRVDSAWAVPDLDLSCYTEITARECWHRIRTRKEQGPLDRSALARWTLTSLTTTPGLDSASDELDGFCPFKICF